MGSNPWMPHGLGGLISFAECPRAQVLKQRERMRFQWQPLGSQVGTRYLRRIGVLIVGRAKERMASSEHNEHDNAASPHVHTFAVEVPLGLLWGHVQESPHAVVYLIES